MARLKAMTGLVDEAHEQVKRFHTGAPLRSSKIRPERGFHNIETAGSADREHKPTVYEVIGSGCLKIANRLARLYVAKYV